MIRERLRRVLRLVCPACGRTKAFEGLTRMLPHCPACGYRFEREQGYFLGSIYFNYGTTVGIEIAGYFALELFFGLKFLEQLPVWMIFSVTFPFWFFRYARCLWMAIDLTFSPPVESDFVVRH